MHISALLISNSQLFIDIVVLLAQLFIPYYISFTKRGSRKYEQLGLLQVTLI